MLLVRPTLVVGLGRGGSAVADEVRAEVRRFEPDLVDQHLLIRFRGAKADEASPAPTGVLADVDRIMRDLDSLRGIQLPQRENRYRIHGGAAADPMFIGVNIILDLCEDNEDRITAELLPGLFQKLSAIQPRYFNICLIVLSARFDGDPVTAEQMQARLVGLNDCVQRFHADLKPRIYLVGRKMHAGRMLESRDQLHEACSLFLQSLIFSVTCREQDVAGPDFLCHGDDSPTYAGFGLMTLDFPIEELAAYYTGRSVADILAQTLKRDEARADAHYAEGREWAQQAVIGAAPSDAPSQVPLPKPRKLNCRAFDRTHRVRTRLDAIEEAWVTAARRWEVDRLDEVAHQVRQVKRTVYEDLRNHQDQVDAETIRRLREETGPLPTASKFLQGAAALLKERRASPPAWVRVPRLLEYELRRLRGGVDKALDHRPNAWALVLCSVLVWAVGGGLLTTVYFRSGAMSFPESALWFLGIPGLVLGCFVAVILNHYQRLVRNAFTAYGRSCVGSLAKIDKALDTNLRALADKCTHRAFGQLTAFADSLCRRVDLLERLLGKKKSKLSADVKRVHDTAAQLENGERLKREHRVVRDSRFRLNMFDETHFAALYDLDRAEHLPLGTLRERLDVPETVISLGLGPFPSDFVRHMKGAARAAWLEVLRGDHFNYDYPPDYRERLKERIAHEVPQLQELFIMDAARLRIPAGVTRKFYVGHRDYRDLLAPHVRDAANEVVVPLARYNRVYLLRVMLGVPFKGILQERIEGEP